MTLEELKDYCLLEDAIKECKDSIARKEAKLAGSRAFDTSGIPKSPTPRNYVEEAYLDLLQSKTELEQKKQEYERLKIRIERYISNIPRLRTRRIFEKYCQGKTFQQIADELGSSETEYSVKHRFYRYLNTAKEE